MDNKTLNKKDNFSIALGLFDYINPILYSITTITIMINLKNEMGKLLFIVFMIGAILSLIFGFMIPTVKFIVGLGKMKFKMPVNLVFFVNLGIFISGMSLATYIYQIRAGIVGTIVAVVISLLGFIIYKSKKFNTIAVLLGAVGYLLIYSSLIKLSLANQLVLPIALYGLAICLFIALVLIGIFADLYDARVHWIIEISNVLCQLSVAIATIFLFKNL